MISRERRQHIALAARLGALHRVGVDPSDARRRLRADDTAVIEETTALLVHSRDVSSMALVCEALTEADASEDFEVVDMINSVLSPAWRSGDVDVPSLLAAVETSGSEAARRGADEVLRWLGVRGST
jgi:hypothetical protein